MDDTLLKKGIRFLAKGKTTTSSNNGRTLQKYVTKYDFGECFTLKNNKWKF